MRRHATLILLGWLCAGACAKGTEPSPAPQATGGSGTGGSGAGGEAGSGGAPIDPQRCAGVDCSELNGLCRVGQCDPADGACKTVATADGARCDDGDRCTVNDACAAGTCVGAAADCSALDGDCHVGACDPTDGTCRPAPVPDGTLCDDGDACTSSDRCAAGSCAGAPLDCSALDGACSVGACNPTTGTCAATATMSGTPCDDANICSWSDACSAAACTGFVIDCDPLGVSFPQASDTAVAGAAADDDFVDDCPFGQVPVGVEAFEATGATAGLTGVATLCGAVSVSQGASGATVAVAPGARVPATGGRGGAAQTGALLSQRCPADQIAVGVEGSAQATTGRIGQLALRCAPLSVTGTAYAGYGVSVGAATATAPIGATTGTPIPATDCPAGTVAHGAHLRAGAVLNGYGLRCGTPTLRLVTTTPRVGSGSGAGIEDDCPEGQFPIGIEARVAYGYWSGILTSFATYCGAATVTPTATGFDVSIAAGARLPASGSRGSWASTGGLLTAACPPNQIVVGVSGTSGGSVSPSNYATQLVLRCAPFTVSGDATSGYTVGVGAVTALSPVGTTPGTPVPARDCPAGMLGRGFYVNSGEILDGVAIRCAPPLLTPL